MIRTALNLDKKDLISLVVGSTPYYSVYDDSLVKKYEHRLVPNKKIEGELPVAFCEKLKKLLKPGADNLYYT